MSNMSREGRKAIQRCETGSLHMANVAGRQQHRKRCVSLHSCRGAPPRAWLVHIDSGVYNQGQARKNPCKEIQQLLVVPDAPQRTEPVQSRRRRSRPRPSDWRAGLYCVKQAKMRKTRCDRSKLEAHEALQWLLQE